MKFLINCTFGLTKNCNNPVAYAIIFDFICGFKVLSMYIIFFKLSGLGEI